MRKKHIVLLALLSTFMILLTVAPIQAQAPVTDDVLTEFDQFIRDEMVAYDIPGMAVAVIAGDDVVYAEGFGVRNLATGEPFTTQTQFRIGSTTKSMTSMLIAQLVDEGLIAWDTPVTELFPTFATGDPERTAQITVADLMGMETGLVSDSVGALTWDDWTIDTLLEYIATMQIGGEFRDFYSYSNEVYALAGYAATVASELDPTLGNYSTLMQDRLFDPIGMESAIITDDPTQLSDNYSESYEISLIDGELSLMGNPPIALMAPAGAVWANIDDMARYVITQMNAGVTPDGTRIVSEEALSRTWQAGAPVAMGNPRIENPAYGMGWITQSLDGIAIQWHNGGWAGYATQMMILPDDDVALIAFTNGGNGSLFGDMLNYAFVEMLHDLEPQFAEQARAVLEAQNAQLEQAQTIVDTHIEDVEAFVGTYEQGWTLEQRDENALWLTGHGWDFQIAYVALLDQYAIINNGAAGTFLTFETDGDAVALVFVGEDAPLLRLEKIG